MSAERHYWSALMRTATRDHGGPIPPGTTVVADDDRTGTRTATSYPMPGRTIVWADPGLMEVLSDLDSPTTLTTAEYVAATEEMGAELVGIGNQRVLDGPLRRPAADETGVRVRTIDRDDAADRALLAELIDVCDDDDVDEADLDLDELDPDIVAFVTPDGRIAAYASARPSEFDDGFDDIAVLTRPEFRGRRLGALAVYEFVRRRQDLEIGRRFLYRCNQANAGSNRVAESLGFTLVQQIGAMRFPPDRRPQPR